MYNQIQASKIEAIMTDMCHNVERLDRNMRHNGAYVPLAQLSNMENRVELKSFKK